MNPTAIIEITEQCNLACDFCLRSSFVLPSMDYETLEKMIFHIVDSSEKRVDFIWHGGEPLKAGLSFFKDILEIQQKYNSKDIFIKNNVQTNATFLNNRFIDFFQENHFEIGTSLQGTKAIHDKSRVYPDGSPTYERVLANISKLKEKPGSILVLTKDILGREEEIYYSLKPFVRGFRISEYLPGGLNSIKNSNLEGVFNDPNLPSPLEMGTSMVKFYNIWKRDESPIELKPITEIIKSFVVGRSQGCLYSQEVCTHSIFGVKSNGDFYTCLRGAPDKEFFLGNVKTFPLKKYDLVSEKNKEKRIEKLLESSCGQCHFWNYCNGGCPLESWKIYENLENKSYYCEGRKMLFEAILEDMIVK